MASTGWERRNARARAQGYDSYYDYRAHDYGRIPPAQPRARGATLARLRGHRSEADLERMLRSGRVELVNTVTTVDRRGRLGVDVLVTLSDGSTIEYRIDEKQAGRVGQTIDDMGSDAPPLVGSPRTLTRFGADESELWEDPDDPEHAQLRDDWEQGLTSR